jgi:quinone-modifying oxidoreductase, subunit QmoB
MADKLAVYICTGYGIAEALDVEALKRVAAAEGKAELVQEIGGCEPGDLDKLRAELAAEGVTRLVLAGPSPRFYARTSLPPELLVDYANIREQVAWVMEPGHEDTQMMAEDNLRMALARVRKMVPLTPGEGGQPINRDILVVGGGVAGLTAALECAETGFQVRLVEKDVLGGFARKLWRSVPHAQPYTRPVDPGIDELVAQVASHPNITVIAGAKIKSISGAPGRFEVTVEGRGPFLAGAIIQATGWKPAEPAHLAHLGYGTIPDVITSVELEEMAKAGRIKRPSTGDPAASVLFVQDEGGTEPEVFSYNSAIASLNALKQAMYVRDQDPNAKAYVIYDMFRAPGHSELFYQAAQRDPGIFLTKGKVASVAKHNGKLAVAVDDTLLGENIELAVDLVVVGVGMKPNSADGEKIRLRRDAQKTIAANEAGGALEKAMVDAVTYAGYEGTEILNLAYRQGPDLPALAWGYPDSHFVCFPYETRRTGIYACGCVRAPMDIQGAIEDATGAALKAIQCVEMTARGEAVHPRAGDRGNPEFFLQRCTQCKRCTEECPFGVLDEDVKGTPLPNPTRCRRCGVCMGACPERIIGFGDYNVDMIASMIKAVNVPDEGEGKPRVLVLACENDAYPALDHMSARGEKFSPFVRIIPVRCIGSVNLVFINEALAKGYDAIILLGCKHGEDRQCHFGQGSELMAARSANVKEKLQQMALENERVQFHQVQITDSPVIARIINDMVETIGTIGMNPFKGM